MGTKENIMKFLKQGRLLSVMLKQRYFISQLSLPLALPLGMGRGTNGINLGINKFPSYL